MREASHRTRTHPTLVHPNRGPHLPTYLLTRIGATRLAAWRHREASAGVPDRKENRPAVPFCDVGLAKPLVLLPATFCPKKALLNRRAFFRFTQQTGR